MNLLFVLYDEWSQQRSHVDGVARELCGRGHDCVVAVPRGIAGLTASPTLTALPLSRKYWRARLFGDSRGPILFTIGTGEVNRRFHDQLVSVSSFKIIIH